MLKGKVRSVSGASLEADPEAARVWFPANDCSQTIVAKLNEERRRTIMVIQDERCVAIGAIQALPVRIEPETYLRFRDWEISPVKIIDPQLLGRGLGKFMVSLLAYDCIVGENSPNHRMSVFLAIDHANRNPGLALRCGFRANEGGRFALVPDQLPELASALASSRSDDCSVRTVGKSGSIELDVSSYPSFSRARFPVMQQLAEAFAKISA